MINRIICRKFIPDEHFTLTLHIFAKNLLTDSPAFLPAPAKVWSLSRISLTLLRFVNGSTRRIRTLAIGSQKIFFKTGRKITAAPPPSPARESTDFPPKLDLRSWKKPRFLVGADLTASNSSVESSQAQHSSRSDDVSGFQYMPNPAKADRMDRPGMPLVVIRFSAVEFQKFSGP